MQKLFLFSSLLLFVGCSMKINPHDKHIVFENGKPYSIPKGANYLKVTNEVHQEMANVNIPCDKNSLFWADPSYVSEHIKGSKLNDEDIIKGYKMGLLGCNQPTSKEEFYYLAEKEKMEKIRSQKASESLDKTLDSINKSSTERLKASTEMFKAMTPRKYDIDVYHHYGY